MFACDVLDFSRPFRIIIIIIIIIIMIIIIIIIIHYLYSVKVKCIWSNALSIDCFR